MIRIITGLRDSGKSTRFLRLYKEEGGDEIGLFSLKRFDAAGHTTGYDVCLLPKGEKLPLARLAAESACFAEEDRLYQGRFVFSRSAFRQAISYILEQSSSSATSVEASATVWIDEVGKLELDGLGYAPLLQQLIEKRVNMVLTIRDCYLPSFLSAYKVDEFLSVRVAPSFLPFAIFD